MIAAVTLVIGLALVNVLFIGIVTLTVDKVLDGTKATVVTVVVTVVYFIWPTYSLVVLRVALTKL